MNENEAEESRKKKVNYESCSKFIQNYAKEIVKFYNTFYEDALAKYIKYYADVVKPVRKIAVKKISF